MGCTHNILPLSSSPPVATFLRRSCPNQSPPSINLAISNVLYDVPITDFMFLAEVFVFVLIVVPPARPVAGRWTNTIILPRSHVFKSPFFTGLANSEFECSHFPLPISSSPDFTGFTDQRVAVCMWNPAPKRRRCVMRLHAKAWFSKPRCLILERSAIIARSGRWPAKPEWDTRSWCYMKPCRRVESNCQGCAGLTCKVPTKGVEKSWYRETDCSHPVRRISVAEPWEEDIWTLNSLKKTLKSRSWCRHICRVVSICTYENRAGLGIISLRSRDCNIDM